MIMIVLISMIVYNDGDEWEHDEYDSEDDDGNSDDDATIVIETIR